MKKELEKALETLKPRAGDPHFLHAAHSELNAALVSMELQTKACRDAALYFLQRIREDSDVRYFCGYGTELFSLLVTAAALLMDKTKDEIQCSVFSNLEENDKLPFAYDFEQPPNTTNTRKDQQCPRD